MEHSNISNNTLNQSPDSEVKNTPIIYTVTKITCLLTLFYALYFSVFLAQSEASILNLFFVLAYSFTFLLAKLPTRSIAKLWFFGTFISHIYILTTIVFSPAVGFHFYYLIIPSGVFLLFNEREKFERYVVLLIGIVAFLICDSNENLSPLVVLPAQSEYFIFVFSIIIIMLENFIVMAVFSSAIANHEAILEEMAAKDPLTTLNNRRTLMTVGYELVAQAKRYKQPLSILLLDIDHFKKINDNYGHLVGDSALQQIALLLKEHLRKSDCLARYGGEEFVLLLPQTDIEAAEKLANNLKTRIANLKIKSNHHLPFNSTVSIGICQLSTDVETLAQLIQQADTALYQAKDNGRNQVAVYTDS